MTVSAAVVGGNIGAMELAGLLASRCAHAALVLGGTRPACENNDDAATLEDVLVNEVLPIVQSFFTGKGDERGIRTVCGREDVRESAAIDKFGQAPWFVRLHIVTSPPHQVDRPLRPRPRVLRRQSAAYGLIIPCLTRSRGITKAMLVGVM
jgi:hypothetical protein